MTSRRLRVELLLLTRRAAVTRVLFFFVHRRLLVAACLLITAYLCSLLTEPKKLLLASAASGSMLGARVALWAGAGVWSTYTTSYSDGSFTFDTSVYTAANTGNTHVLQLLLQQPV